MAQAKRASKGKRPNKAVSVLGIAGVSLAASTGGSPADISPASVAAPTLGPVADILWQNAAPFKIPMLDEEEISDVSLATFYLFDKESPGSSRPGVQLAVFRAEAAAADTAAEGAAEAAAAVSRLRRLPRLRRRRLQRLRRWRLQRLRRWLSRMRLGRLRRLRRARSGAGAAAAACRGEAAPSARPERPAIALTRRKPSGPGLTRFDPANDLVLHASQMMHASGGRRAAAANRSSSASAETPERELDDGGPATGECALRVLTS